MTTGTSERSRLALLRWLLPHGGPPPVPPDALHIPAAEPGQNTWETYGLAALTTLIHLLFAVEWLGRWPIWLALPLGLALAVLVLHLSCFAWVGTTAIGLRFGCVREEARQAMHHAMQTCWTTFLAAMAITLPLPISQWLGWVWLGLLALNLFAWLALRGWLALLLVGLAHAGVAWLWLAVGWRWGWPALFATHMIILHGLLRPNSQIFGRVQSRFASPGKQLWLTIDDGPRPEFCPAMLGLLAKHQAKATFFLIGREAERYPELVQAITREGHAIGNHTRTHPQAWFWALPPWRVSQEIGLAQATLARLSGQESRHFRGPVGFKNLFLPPILVRHGLAYLGWSARCFDAVAKDQDVAWARLRRDLRPGAIVLLHQTAIGLAVLEKLLSWMAQENYTAAQPELGLRERSSNATTVITPDT